MRSWIAGHQERTKEGPLHLSRAKEESGIDKQLFPHTSEGSKGLPRKAAACTALDKKQWEIVYTTQHNK